VRNARVWRALLGVENTVVEGVEFVEGDDEEDEQDGDRAGVLVAHVRAVRSARGRCGICRRRCGRYDNGEGNCDCQLL
jgi:transposase